jgi:hypothetical protein
MTPRKKTTAEVKNKPRNVAISATIELLEKTDNPWTEIPKVITTTRNHDDFIKSVNHCRFFYKTEPVVSTVIDKLVEIGINDLVFSKSKLSENEHRVFTSLKPKLLEFSEQLATEYLLSGLVVPEIGFSRVDKDQLFKMGIKKYPGLELPDSMWVRDPSTIKIRTSLVADKPSYFVKVPTDLINFIKSKGEYPDGKKDERLYEILTTQFPEFVEAILGGETEILLENEHILRRKYTSDNPYPIPYIQSAIEALHHKRKMRRMDYSVMDKVISAIMHVKVGDKDFPITQSDEDQEYLESLASQLRMRGNNQQILERIFQLVTTHTVDINWIFPETSTLLDANKYNDINQEILFGLGFPRVLITGEAQKSGTSDSEIATLSPLKTAEGFRRKVIEVIQDICAEISERNNFKDVPEVHFTAINLHKFQDFLNGLRMLYDTASVSRTTLGKYFGVDFDSEADLMESEMKKLREKGLPEFGATPNSKNSVLLDEEGPNGEKPENGDTGTDKKVKKPKKSVPTE